MVRGMALAACAVALAGCGGKVVEVYETRAARPGGEITFVVSAASNSNPYRAGREAAELLKRSMVGPPRAILVSECFDGASAKAKVLRGICSVFPEELVFGGATYGSFTQLGVADRDGVALLGIVGEGVYVSAALERELGTARLSAEKDQAEIQQRLRAAGASLVRKLPAGRQGNLLIVMADAHSPKNAPLVEGVQDALVKSVPLTGGSVNKNAGQTYVYFQGRMYQDSAIALLVSGEFRAWMAGRQAKEGGAVVETARGAAREAIKGVEGKPLLALAFDCAGRKGKLANPGDELEAIRSAIGREAPLFGCYCAGEIGPADTADPRPSSRSSGVGWHIMFTILGR